MKTILVTGGAGFIGSNLCKKLVNCSDSQVICLDDLSTGKMDNLDPIIGCPNFSFLQADVSEPIDLQVDQIYHAACPASPKCYQLHPTKTAKTCALGTLNMLELARKNHAVFMLFSTSEVYGNPLVHPQPESYWRNVNPNGIRSCYDEGKRFAESICFDYHREFNVDIKVIRIFNTYGPNMAIDDGRVVSNFIVQALQRKHITVYGDGTQTRSFQYIDDLLDGIDQVMNHTPHEFTGPINLGNPDEITIQELALKISSLTECRTQIVYAPLPQDDPIRRKADITLATRVLNGWHPEICIDEGLKKTIAYFKQRIHEKP